MPCYHPIQAWRSKFASDETGKRGLVFGVKGSAPSGGDPFSPLMIPCGQCIGCRLERSRQWAIRILHEAKLHEVSCFLTLTYADEHLPEGGTLVKAHFQKFLKRLRKAIAPIKVRFFHCGEYGDIRNRPHYHCILFGYGFPDKVLLKRTRNGDNLYRSKQLDSLWSHGHCFIGAVTFESAAYVGRYCVKKVTGKDADTHYRSLDTATGECFDRVPEYVTMSLKPGIGREFFLKYKDEILANDSVICRGIEMKPPRFYDKLHEELDSEALEAVKLLRRQEADKHASNNTSKRLRVREAVKTAEINLYKRSVD